MVTASAEPAAGRTVVLQLTEWGSGPIGPAEAHVGHVTLGRRLIRGGIPMAVAAVLTLLILPVPLMHLAGIPLLVLGIYFGVRNARAREVFLDASGTCPSCHSQTKLFIGFGKPPFKLPVKTSCGSCGRNLMLKQGGE